MLKTTTIFGIRAIIEAIETQQNIEKIFLQKQADGSLMQQLKKKIAQNTIAFSYVPIEKLNKLSKFGNHQGAVAKMAAINYADLEQVLQKTLQKKKCPLFLILDKISDVRNLGSIIRTGYCTGVHAIILPKNHAANVNEQTIKTSSGAAFKIPICRVNHIKDALFVLESENIQIVAATEKATKTAYQVDFKKPTALVMGSENKGIQPSILKMCDVKAKLPIMGTIGSLNVSVACGAFLYEILRQREIII